MADKACLNGTGSGQMLATGDDKHDPSMVSAASFRFLNDQHAVVLSGLQVEIEKLRETCAELQFKLVFNGATRSCDSDEDNVNLTMKAELTETRRACQELRTTVDQLNHRLRQQEERYQEDIGARNLIVAKLRKEVQEKKNTISNLVKLLRVRPDRSSSASVNLNRDAILRRAEAQIGSIEPGPMLTVFSPKVVGSSSSCGPSSASPLATSQSQSRSAPGSLSDLGKQLMEKYCGRAASPVASSVAGYNGNRRPRRPDSLETTSQQMRPAPVSILEPWSPHQNNGST